jgi:exosortase/archaeosortase family protein
MLPYNKSFLRFLLIFVCVFAVCYFGSLAIVGLSSPGRYYIPAIEKYFNYVKWLRQSLMASTQWLLSLRGVDTYYKSEHVLSQVGGRGIKLVYSCLGLGIMSLWLAFVVAWTSPLKRKLIWIIGGLFIIWLLNITRLTLFLYAINQYWKMPFGIDHHTWFNIVAYGAIFLMMYLFTKSKVKRQNPKVGSTIS